jgi:hypothetical protein
MGVQEIARRRTLLRRSSGSYSRALPEVREDRWQPYRQKLKIQNALTITVFFATFQKSCIHTQYLVTMDIADYVFNEVRLILFMFGFHGEQLTCKAVEIGKFLANASFDEDGSTCKNCVRI